VETFIRDLLGPAAGPNEEVDEREILDRYLVGLLAPKRQEVAPEQNDEFAVAGKGTPEEGTTEPSGPPVRMLFPSSFGMTFCVDLDAAELQVEANWGQYKREDSETVNTDGHPKLVWKRHPRAAVQNVSGSRTGRYQSGGLIRSARTSYVTDASESAATTGASRSSS